MNIYRFNLNTYKQPPNEEYTLNELKAITTERLQLYNIMNNATNMDLTPNSKMWDDYVQSKIIQSKLRSYIILLNSEEDSIGLLRARKNNHIAHWLLSLRYCCSNKLMYFFMCCELSWFVMLYKRIKEEDLDDFLEENELKYIKVSREEKLTLKINLYLDKNDESAIDNTIYYKTEFTEVINLVKERRIILYKGYAYFPESDIIFCIKNKLWRQFNEQLYWTNKMISTNLPDRIQEFFTNIPIVTPTDIHINNTLPKINLENIDEISVKHFPPCMMAIHEELRTEHHLKYDCKMQYGVFLKCLGLEYEDAMTFWKEEFTEKMSLDKYIHKYSYLFKHQYGKVGGKLDYKPYTCTKIQNMSPGPGQHHGCPFKHWDMNRLLEKCLSDGLHVDDNCNIKRLIAEGRFKEACTVYFCAKYKVIREDIIESPNQYVKESFEMENSLDNCLDTMLENCDTRG